MGALDTVAEREIHRIVLRVTDFIVRVYRQCQKCIKSTLYDMVCARVRE